jgi:hypothetical protein
MKDGDPPPSSATAMRMIEVLDQTEPLPAGAGRISDVLFQVLKYAVFRDGAVGG